MRLRSFHYKLPLIAFKQKKLNTTEARSMLRRGIIVNMPTPMLTNNFFTVLLLQQCISVAWPELWFPFGRHNLWTGISQPASPRLPSCTTWENREAGVWGKPSTACIVVVLEQVLQHLPKTASQIWCIGSQQGLSQKVCPSTKDKKATEWRQDS